VALAAAENTEWNVVTREDMILAVSWTTSTSFSRYLMLMRSRPFLYASFRYFLERLIETERREYLDGKAPSWFLSSLSSLEEGLPFLEEGFAGFLGVLATEGKYRKFSSFGASRGRLADE
jgi:hypothetical protein